MRLLAATIIIAFAFQTRAMGILQITGFTDNPRGVQLRSKLLQPAVK